MRSCERTWSSSIGRDDRAVSEVIGYILTFGILAALIVMSMLAFNTGKEDTEDTIVRLKADAIAHRVSTVMVDAALFGERHGDDGEFTRILDLPSDLQGKSYEIRLLGANAGGPDRIEVEADGQTSTAILFSAGSASQFSICDTTLQGEPMAVRYGPDPLSPSDRCLFLEDL